MLHVRQLKRPLGLCKPLVEKWKPSIVSPITPKPVVYAQIFSRYLCVSTQRHDYIGSKFGYGERAMETFTAATLDEALTTFYAEVRTQKGILKSKFSDLQIPSDVSLSQYLLSKFEKYGDKIALVDADSNHSYTYRQLKDLVRRCSSGLVKSGFKQGDVCALYQPNSADVFITSYSVVSIGGVLSSVNPTFTVDEFSDQLDHTDAQWIITVPSYVDKANEAAKRVGNIKGIYVVGDEHVDGCIPFSTFMKDDGSAFPTDIKINPKEDVVFLPYSSGTTGLPKGVMLTHYNIISSIEQLTKPESVRIEDGDNVTLALLPLSHAGGFVLNMTRSLLQGYKIIIPPMLMPELEVVLRNVEEHKVTTILKTPPYVQLLVKDPNVDKYDLSSLKHIEVGAAPVSFETIESAKKRLSSHNKELIIQQVYGLTEATTLVTMCSLRDECPPGSCGLLLPNTEAKVVDHETGEVLRAGEDGELCFRGPQIMKGYLKNEKATNETLVDGWLHTGDIGHYDETGHFFVVARLKEFIKYMGVQVAPAQLEAVLLTNPDIQDAAVIGVPDEKSGEVPKAFVVPTSDKLTPVDVIKFVEERVAPYKKLRGGVEFIDQIPKSATGKILRKLLKAKEMERINQK
ncbi:uncharacterized protein LOC144445367 [Glandiceps talaboti]